MCRLTFIMESTSFTNLVCGNIFVLSRNIVSLTSLERLTKSPIIQELRRWPGQNHELHGSQQTTIKGGDTVMSRGNLSSPETTFSLQQKPKNPSQKTRRRKRSIPTSKHSLPNSIKHPNNPLHDTCFQGIILPLFIKSSLIFLAYLSSFYVDLGCSRLLSAVVILFDRKVSTADPYFSPQKGQHNSRSRRSAPSAIRQICGPGLEFWAQQPINTSSTHLQPITRRHLAPGDF
jgi:hypothetical protein